MSLITYTPMTPAPSTPGAGLLDTFALSDDLIIRAKDEYGNTTLLNNVQIASTVASSGAIANTDTKIGAGLKVTRNTLTVGSVIRITIMGTCTSSAAGSQIFTVRFGSGNVVGDTLVATATLVAQTSGTNIPFKLVIELTIRSIGGSGTVYGTATLINQGTTGIYTLATGNFVLAGALAIASNADGYIGVSYISGNASTACTFQNVITELIRQ